MPGRIKRIWRRWRAGAWATRSGSARTLWFLSELLLRLLSELGRVQVVQRAGAVAFFVVLALVPFLMLLVMVAEQFGLLQIAGEGIFNAAIQNYIPVETAEIVQQLLQWVQNARQKGVTIVGMAIAFLASWSLFSGYYTLLNDLWHVPRGGELLHRLSRFGLLIVMAPPLLAISASLSTVQFLGFAPAGEIFSVLGSGAVAPVMTFFVALAGLKGIPRTYVKWRYALVSALLAAVVFELTKYGFGLYVSNVVRNAYRSIYGVLFLLPVFLIWNYVVAIFVAAITSVSYLLQNWGDYDVARFEDAAEMSDLDEQEIALGAMPSEEDDENELIEPPDVDSESRDQQQNPANGERPR